MAKPLTCWLGQHRWVERHDPETNAAYQACRFCDLERDTRLPRMGVESADDANRINPGGLPFG